MKLYARIIAMLCALVMLVSMFAACANTGNDDTTAPDNTVNPEATTEFVDPTLDPEGYLKDDLPADLKYDETVTILYWSDAERAEFEILEEEVEADMVREAIYNRNLATEERLGVTFEWVGQDGDSGNRGAFTTYVQNQYAGGTYYDIIATYSRTAGMLLVEGLLEDINQIDDCYINLEKPWWPKTMLETCEIDDSLFVVSGDISTNVLHFMYAVYYNMYLHRDLQLPDPIEMVDNKKWTIDAMIEMSSDLYTDLDQDGSPSDGDRFGFGTTYYHLDALYTGSGLKLVEPATDGNYLKISDDFFGQKTIDLVDKLGAWFDEGDSYVNPSGGDINYTTPFEEGNMLFCLNRVYMADNEYHSGALRNVDWEYGILPVPLYDDSQSDYLTVVGNPFTLWCIMDNCKDATMSSAVIECLASEGYRKTSPALFENNMKYRYTPDDAGKGDSARMFDMIRGSIQFDLGRIFSDSLSYMSELPSKAAASSSSWASMKAQLDRALSRQMTTLNKDLEEVIG